MTVVPSIQAFLDQLKSLPKMDMDQITPEQYRAKEKEMLAIDQGGESVKKVENRVLHLEGRDIPVRVYIPNEGEDPYPCLVYYHGGGWVIGDLDSHDSICRLLANRAKCVVVSVHYRRAPEHKFPAAVDDAYDSLVEVVNNGSELNIDVNRIAVGGDSAGGNLATVTCMKAYEQGTPNIIHQFLLYPSIGFKGDTPPPSLVENADGYFLTLEMMQWFSKQYFNDPEERNQPYASPIFFEKLGKLPPATLLTAQYDPLRDEGKAFADELKANGVDVFYKNYEGLIHGFGNFIGFSPESEQALREGAEQLKKVFIPKNEPQR
ncbi:acetyl esterase [Salinibacillus kushneri]|uniref:Acetyl esterase n=1 Tax=Salinibacillus kushneri TaxID=237682 RepID=A0A1H9YGC1_9BACI|nr:alpha/beta hydrolase [Salinibacillus kushneri]SES67976.1 acetyl esterase [Salinibacillus kushneri]